MLRPIWGPTNVHLNRLTCPFGSDFTWSDSGTKETWYGSTPAVSRDGHNELFGPYVLFWLSRRWELLPNDNDTCSMINEKHLMHLFFYLVACDTVSQMTRLSPVTNLSCLGLDISYSFQLCLELSSCCRQTTLVPELDPLACAALWAPLIFSGQLPEFYASVGVDFCHAATSLVPPPGGSPWKTRIISIL